MEYLINCGSLPRSLTVTYRGRPLHRHSASCSLSIFAIPIFACSLIITVVLQSWYKENGREWLFIATIVNLSLGLTMYLIRPVYVMIDDYNRAQSSKIKALTQTKMANIVDAAVAVTRDWVATKNGYLQKHLTANDTSQVDLKVILAISSKIEAVIQNCEKAQAMCQAAVKSQDSSIASKQATEILQAIATAEGYLLEVEQMLPQPHHPDIQIA
jgi:dipeptide/tripeptide permease